MTPDENRVIAEKVMGWTLPGDNDAWPPDKDISDLPRAWMCRNPDEYNRWVWAEYLAEQSPTRKNLYDEDVQIWQQRRMAVDAS